MDANAIKIILRNSLALNIYLKIQTKRKQEDKQEVEKRATASSSGRIA